MRSKPPLGLPQAEALAREYGMFPKGGTVLLAVSGGRDSMTLLHWAWTQAETFGVSLAVGHYHHGMRGESADDDARRVEAWCREHGIPFYQDNGDVYGEAARMGRGVEETGRLLRYAFLERTAAAIGAMRIATAHNADDNAETLLLNLTRGAGLQGLCGIPPVRKNIVRPLLTTSRAEINAYVAEHAIPYGDDETNFDDTYARNRIRNQVTPVLRSLNARYTENVSTAIRLLRQDNDCLNGFADQLLEGVRAETGRAVLPASRLAEAPIPIAVRAARTLMTGVTGFSQFGERHLRAVLDLAKSGDPSAQISLPHGLIVRREYGALVFTTEQESQSWGPVPLKEGENRVGAWTVTVAGNPGSLTARPRRTGDEIRLPRQAKKTLKKLMMEKRIPRPLRDSLPVAADGDGPLAVALLGENTDHPRFGAVHITFTQNQKKE